MSLILSIESATKNCSVALSDESGLISLKEEHSQKYIHAERLHILIKEVIGDRSKDLSAIAISKGPGSYTGLRIGTAASKGLCFALDLPLIALSTLEHMAAQAREEHPGFDYYLPMIDARRMEVYTATFDATGNTLQEAQALEVLEESFIHLSGTVLKLGDCAGKCEGFLQHPSMKFNASFLPSAKGMSLLAHSVLAKKKTVDPAYFEPYYLKEFVAGKPKSLL